MESVDIKQSILIGLSKLLITPVMVTGGFRDYFKEVFNKHSVLTSIGASASDLTAQYLLDSTVTPLEQYIGYKINTVHLGQAVLTGGVYMGGDWILRKSKLYNSRNYAYFSQEWYDFFYITLLDTFAQAATPTVSTYYGGNNKMLKNAQGGTKISYNPVMQSNLKDNTPKGKLVQPLPSNATVGRKNKIST